jgi:hypothetical protein
LVFILSALFIDHCLSGFSRRQPMRNPDAGDANFSRAKDTFCSAAYGESRFAAFWGDKNRVARLMWIVKHSFAHSSKVKGQSSGPAKALPALAKSGVATDTPAANCRE